MSLNPLSDLFDPAAVSASLIAAGVTPPADLERIASVTAALSDHINGHSTPLGGMSGHVTESVSDEILNVAAEDAVAFLEERALERATSEYFEELYRKSRTGLHREARRIIREAADDLIAEGRPRFEELVAEARPLVRLVGAGPVEPDRILNGGTALREAYDKLLALRPQLDAASSVRQILAAEGYGHRVEGPSWYLAEAETPNDMARADSAWNDDGHRLSNLIATGQPLTLNTAAQTDALLAGIVVPHRSIEPSAEHVEAEQERERQRRDSWNRHMEIAFGKPDEKVPS